MYRFQGQRSRGIRGGGGGGGGGAPTIGGGMLPSGGVVGLGPTVVNALAYVDPVHPNAADDGALDTPFLTGQGAVDALAAVIGVSANPRGPTVLYAAGTHTGPALVLPAGRFWTIVILGDFLSTAGIVLEVDANDGGLAVIAGPIAPTATANDADVGYSIGGGIAVVDTGAGGGTVRIDISGLRTVTGCDATGHTGLSVWRLRNCVIGGDFDAPGGQLEAAKTEFGGTVVADLYGRLSECFFGDDITFASGFAGTDIDGFVSCDFGFLLTLTAPDEVFMDPMSVGRLQTQIWILAGGAFLARLGNTTRTLWYGVENATTAIGVALLPVVDIPNDNASEVGIAFQLPFDYPEPGQSIVGKLLRLDIFFTPAPGAAAASPLTFTITTMAGTIGESIQLHTNGPSAVAGVAAATAADWAQIPVADRIPDARAGDLVSVKLSSPVANGGTVSVAGIRLIYRPQ